MTRESHTTSSTAGSIGLVTTDLYPLTRASGLGVSTWLLARLLAGEGWRVHVLFCGGADDRAALAATQSELAAAGIGWSHLDGLGTPKTLAISSIYNSECSNRSDRVRHALLRLDDLHCFDLVEFADSGGLGFRSIQAKRQGLAFDHVRFSVTLHAPSPWVRDGNHRWMTGPEDLRLDFCERYAFEHADLQLSPSRYMLDYVRSIGWRPRDDARVIPYPFPDHRFAPADPAAAPSPEIVFFGRLETRKGLEIFLDAVEHLDPQISITFLGEDAVLADDQPASGLIQSRLQGRNFRLLTNFNREQALGYLAGANRLAVIPSLADNFPVTVLDCAVGGVPFVASRVGGIPEIVTDPEVHSRLLFAPNARDLRRCLEDYLRSDPAGRDALRKKIHVLTDATSHNAQVAGCYRELLLARPIGSTAAVTPTTRPVAENPLVTVCVPHYNLGAFLPDALASLAAQTYPRLEVLVLDDGSTDPESIRAFADAEHRYPQFRFLRQPNAGVCAARNRCLAEANGEYFIPVDADNIADPCMTERFVKAIRKNPQLSALSCYFLAFRQTADISRGDFTHAYRPTGGPHVLASLENLYGDTNAIFRTADLRAVNGYETDRDSSTEDWEVFVKLVHAGYRIDVVPQPLFYYRYREDSWSRVTSGYANQRRVLRQYFRAPPLPDAEQIALWTAWVSFSQYGPPAQQLAANANSQLTALHYRIADRLNAALRKVPFAHSLARTLILAAWQVWKRLSSPTANLPPPSPRDLQPAATVQTQPQASATPGSQPPAKSSPAPIPPPSPSPASTAAEHEPANFQRFLCKYPVFPPQTLEEIRQSKISLVTGLGKADSIRDYGGLWAVHGLYLLQGAKALNCQYAEMIDMTPREEFSEKARELQAEMDVRVEFKREDFRDPDLYKSLIPVDVSLLYDVMLHQDNPEEVIKNVSSKTKRCVCIAQPVLKEEMFILPNGCVNLQFYPEELKDLLRIVGCWPKEPVVNRFVTNCWMWGQTVSYFKSIFFGYGWDIEHLEAYRLSAHWNYALMRFLPRKT